MKKLYDFIENGVRRTTLGAKRPISHENISKYISKIPVSHKRYAFTLKENRNTMLPYLKQDPAYYDKLLHSIFINNKLLRIAIYTEEYDSHNTRHLHGIISTNKHLRYTAVQIPGMQFHFIKIRKPLKPLTADEIRAGGPIRLYEVPKTSEPYPPKPEYWEKYILKGNKTELKLIYRVSKKIKILDDSTKKENGIQTKATKTSPKSGSAIQGVS